MGNVDYKQHERRGLVGFKLAYNLEKSTFGDLKVKLDTSLFLDALKISV